MRVLEKREAFRSGHVIQGDFTPVKRVRLVRWVTKAAGILLGCVLLSSLAVYGLTVQYETQINNMAQRIRLKKEENTELEVQLNRIQSSNNVAEQAQKVPSLRPASEIVTVKQDLTQMFPPRSVQPQSLPSVYGY